MAKSFIEQLANINSTSFELIESLTDYQLKRMKSYTNLMASRVSDFSEIKDTNGLREYLVDQNDFVRQILHNVNLDNKELATLIQQYSEKIRDSKD